MMTSSVQTVEAYLNELPHDRRAVVSAVVELIRANLPKGYGELMSFGMICWGIPLEDYPDTYNGQPLCYAALAAQKKHYALYLMGPYMDPQQDAAIRDGFASAGKKLDMGKSCLRFRRTEDLALDTVARAIASMPPRKYIELYEASRAATSRKRAK